MPKARADVIESVPKLRIGHLAWFVITIVVIVFVFIRQEPEASAFCVPASSQQKWQEKKCIVLETADDNRERANGLSNRDSMPQNEGVLFVFDNSDKQCFWMKGMNFGLDIVWLDGNKEVTKIDHDISPETYPETYCSDMVKYVIELNEGVVEKLQLRVGQKLNI